MAEGGIAPVDKDVGQQGCSEAPARQNIVDLLLGWASSSGCSGSSG
jgi:hypothetical protein